MGLLEIYKEFQSTSPVRGTTEAMGLLEIYKEFQSTSPVRGTTLPTWRGLHREGVSIHVPRAGDDSNNSQKYFL